MEEEIWKDVPEYEGYYQVSNLGRVRSLGRPIKSHGGYFQWRQGQMMNPNIGRQGYRRVGLHHPDKKSKGFNVNWLVLRAFVGPCPPGEMSRHFPDNNPANNRLDNLRWGTAKQNSEDKIFHGTVCAGERNPYAKLTNQDVIRIREIYFRGRASYQFLGEMFGVTGGTIKGIVLRKTWKHLK